MTDHERAVIVHNLNKLTAFLEVRISNNSPEAMAAYANCGEYKNISDTTSIQSN